MPKEPQTITDIRLRLHYARHGGVKRDRLEGVTFLLSTQIEDTEAMLREWESLSREVDRLSAAATARDFTLEGPSAEVAP